MTKAQARTMAKRIADKLFNNCNDSHGNLLRLFWNELYLRRLEEDEVAAIIESELTKRPRTKGR